ncbi:MAG: DNA primase [Acetobacteraceae bacterium]|nr:DNA primase [Acetobacteraceae bacterium]
MALPPAFLDELRSRTPLHGLIGRKVRLNRNGRQWKGCCPFHNEKTPSFYVYDDHFHCFGCGAHGDAITFLMRAEGASFPEAVERLAAEAGLDVPKPSREAQARERHQRDLHGVLAAAEANFRARLHRPEGHAALDYLRGRGLSDETIARFGLGWSGEGRGALAAELKASEGIEPAQLAEAGLLKPKEGGGGYNDFFFNRVMFPIRDRRGRTISFGGRVLGDGQPKYVNGPETALFQKRRGLYGLDLAREAAFRGAAVVAVEGYMDVIALHQAGFGAAVAPLGTALTPEQLGALWQLSPEPVLCFDGDAAGARAAARAAEIALPLLAPERTLRLATLPNGEDPDTLLAQGGAGAVRAVLEGAKPLSAALYDLLAEGRPAATPEQRAALRGRLEAAARAIADKALASEYRRALLDRFFEAGRKKNFRVAVKPQRAAVDLSSIRSERARNLLAILLKHPAILPEIEESLAGIDLPDGHPETLRAALLAHLARGDVLDSTLLLDQLASSRAGEAVTWALRGPGLAKEARPDTQPAEALAAWWHFFALLRGEAELSEDCAQAERHLAATNDPAAERRLKHLTEARLALRSGEIGLGTGADS